MQQQKIKEILLTISGESQVGKSAFVNLICGYQEGQRGGAGRSVTQKLNIHETFWQPMGCNTKFIDLPGFNNTEREKDLDQLDQIIEFYHTHKITQARALLHFISLSQSATHIKKSIQYLSQNFNKKSAKKSLIVILTKGDQVFYSQEEGYHQGDPQEITKKLDIIKQQFSQFGFSQAPIIRWVSCKYDEQSDQLLRISKISQQYLRQEQDLIDSINKVSSYQFEASISLGESVQNLAKQLEEQYLQSTKQNTVVKQYQIKDQTIYEQVDVAEQYIQKIFIPNKMSYQQKGKPSTFFNFFCVGFGMLTMWTGWKLVAGAAAKAATIVAGAGTTAIYAKKCIESKLSQSPRNKDGTINYVHKVRFKKQKYPRIIQKVVENSRSIFIYAESPGREYFIKKAKEIIKQKIIKSLKND